MEKQPTQAEIKNAILDGMCKAVDEEHLGIEFNEEEVCEMIPAITLAGRLDYALQNLLSTDSISYNVSNNCYLLSRSSYKSYVENQDFENEESEANEESDPWRPIQVEDYEGVAGEIEEFSAEIKAENGLRASHPDETDFMIETADATAKSLRDKEGVITRKRLSTLIDDAHRILEICDATTRIGKVIHAFIEFIRPFL